MSPGCHQCHMCHKPHGGAAPLCSALLCLKISPEVQSNPCFGKPGPPRGDSLQGPCSEMQHLRGLCVSFDQEIFFRSAPGGFEAALFGVCIQDFQSGHIFFCLSGRETQTEEFGFLQQGDAQIDSKL